MRRIALFAAASAIACAACGVLLGSSGDDDSTPPAVPTDAQPSDATGIEGAVDTGAPAVDAGTKDSARDADADADADAIAFPDVDGGPSCTVELHDDFEDKSGATFTALWNPPSATTPCQGASMGTTPHGLGLAELFTCTSGSGESYFMTAKKTFVQTKRVRFSFSFQIGDTGDAIFFHVTNVFADYKGFGFLLEHATNTLYGGPVDGTSGTSAPSAKDVQWALTPAGTTWHSMVLDISFPTGAVNVEATLDGTPAPLSTRPTSTAMTPMSARFGIDHGAGAQQNAFDDITISTCP